MICTSGRRSRTATTVFGKHSRSCPAKAMRTTKPLSGLTSIEPITGEKVNALSYPEGAYGTLTMDALRSQGIELTFTTQPGVNAVVQGLPQTLYSMHRITMTEDTNMDEFLAGNGVYVQPEFELATSDMIVQFVRRNLGVGCVMRDFARDYVESGLLFELRFNKIIPKRQFCVVRNTKMPMAPAAEKLLEIMELDRQEEAKI